MPSPATTRPCASGTHFESSSREAPSTRTSLETGSGEPLDIAARAQHPGSRVSVANRLGRRTAERLEPCDPADSRPQRVDEAVLGRGQARRASAAALPELPALPASAVRDLRALHVDRSGVRAG